MVKLHMISRDGLLKNIGGILDALVSFLQALVLSRSISRTCT